MKNEEDFLSEICSRKFQFEILKENGLCKVNELIVQPHKKTSLQSHEKRSEHWIILNGMIKVTIGKDKLILRKNQHLYVPTSVKHQIHNMSDEPVHIIEVQLGTYFGEDDITRF